MMEMTNYIESRSSESAEWTEASIERTRESSCVHLKRGCENGGAAGQLTATMATMVSLSRPPLFEFDELPPLEAML